MGLLTWRGRVAFVGAFLRTLYATAPETTTATNRAERDVETANSPLSSGDLAGFTVWLVRWFNQPDAIVAIRQLSRRRAMGHRSEPRLNILSVRQSFPFNLVLTLDLPIHVVKI